jgi:hypothetical protein
MRSFVCRLLMLAAVLLMPFAMSAAPAAAAHHAQMSTMPMQHCPEPDRGTAGKSAVAHCTMPCSAALPAVDLVVMTTPPELGAPVEPGFIRALRGIQLEIATPPPRLS